MRTVDRKGFFGWAVGLVAGLVGALPFVSLPEEVAAEWARDPEIGPVTPDYPDYATTRDGGLPGHTITVDGHSVPHVFEFCVSERWVRAYYIADPCPACGHEGGGKHLRWWGGTRTRGWEMARDGSVFPAYPEPTGCWGEFNGDVRLLDRHGKDVTKEYLRGLS